MGNLISIKVSNKAYKRHTSGPLANTKFVYIFPHLKTNKEKQTGLTKKGEY